MKPALFDQELVVVTGKGGVGKSVVAAALGTLLAETKRVLVLEVDPRENVHQLFGAPPSGGEIVALGPQLYLQNLKPGQVVDQLVEEKLRIKQLVRRILASPIYRQFADSAPGLEEMAVLGHALRALRGLSPKAPQVDTVVLDAPATGHGVSLLAAPLLVGEVIEHGPIGALTRQVAELVGDQERSGIVVVTLAEEMPATEAIELRSMLSARLDRQPDLLVVNGLYPATSGEIGGDEASRLWARRRELNERELDRLGREWPERRVELPLLPLDRGEELVAALTAVLRQELAVGGEP